jgi:hypothetical protein
VTDLIQPIDRFPSLNKKFQRVQSIDKAAMNYYPSIDKALELETSLKQISPNVRRVCHKNKSSSKGST